MIRRLVLASLVLALVGCGSAHQAGTKLPSIQKVKKNKLAAIAKTQAAAKAQGPRNVVGRRSPCVNGSVPSWSADGKQIVFSGSRVLCVADADGSHIRPLTANGGLVDTAFQLDWVRPGLLLFDDDYAISGLRPGGKTLFQGIEAPSFTVAADGSRFATGTQSDCPDCVGQAHVWTTTGKLVGTIGSAKDYYDAPSLSPDGASVAYEQERAIWVAGADGSNPQELVGGLGPADAQPRWSPKGDEIAYVSSEGLWVIAAGGGTPRLVARGLEDSGDWSPNGKLIASRDVGNVAVVNVATGKVRALRFVGYPDPGAPAWSPDSKQLLMTARLSARCYSLWREPVDGSKPQLLSSCY